HVCEPLIPPAGPLAVFNFFFFFQAEDGIRDGHVTGVQTCLFRSLVDSYGDWPTHVLLIAGGDPYSYLLDTTTGVVMKRDPELSRSEERRVGKEWRTRWALGVGK